MRTLDSDQIYSPFLQRIDTLTGELRQTDQHLRQIAGMDESTLVEFRAVHDALDRLRARIGARWSEALEAEQKQIEADAEAEERDRMNAILTAEEQLVLRLTPTRADPSDDFVSLSEEDGSIIARLREMGFIFDTHTGVGYRRTQAGTRWLNARDMEV